MNQSSQSHYSPAIHSPKEESKFALRPLQKFFNKFVVSKRKNANRTGISYRGDTSKSIEVRVAATTPNTYGAIERSKEEEEKTRTVQAGGSLQQNSLLASSIKMINCQKFLIHR